MAKRIIILNGSPRKNGNTAELIKSFIKGANEAGNTVAEFFLNEMDIHGCLGCFGGGPPPKVLACKKTICSKSTPNIRPPML